MLNMNSEDMEWHVSCYIAFLSFLELNSIVPIHLHYIKKSCVSIL